MALYSFLLKLGAVLSGTNTDLAPLAPKGKGKPDTSLGDDDGDGGEEVEGTANEGGRGGIEGAASSILAALLNGEEDGRVDQQDALAQAVQGALLDGGAVESGEAPWCPWSTADDRVRAPSTTSEDRVKASNLLASVRDQTSFLRARLRNKFLEARTSRDFHGVRKGSGLSERRIADTWAEIQSGINPTRPDYRSVQRPNVNLATAVVVDESGSMDKRVKDAARAMLAIVDPLDHLGCPTLAVGFRCHYESGLYPNSEEYYDAAGKPRYHRGHAVTIDLFKDWHEPLRATLGRFAKVKATGSTPMADGIQFALQGLSERKERHRILFVITDGEPDGECLPVVRRQIRLAREAGITIVGIGIDSGCYSVGRLFDKFVGVTDVAALPAELLNIVSEIVFPSSAKRVALDGKMTTKAA
jgi:nitric oxide reductase activation protein